MSRRITVEVLFELGQTVYLKTDDEQLERIVTGIFLRPNGCVIYYLSSGTNETPHYDIEIDSQRDVVRVVS